MDGVSFTDVLRRQTDHIIDACTRCGKCAEACPMTEPAGVDVSDAPALIGGILDLLRGEEGTANAERWALVCSNSGKCITACAYGINPRLMVNLARIASKSKQGEAAVRKAVATSRPRTTCSAHSASAPKSRCCLASRA
jgi:Fe-S oxidoreductase